MADLASGSLARRCPALVIADPLDYLSVLRQTPPLSAVRVDHPLISVDIEHANRALFQTRLEAQFLLDHGRQTGGRTQVSSLVTVDYLDPLDFAHTV